ncbi:hypothetical protein [Clostridium sp.]|uniref:hypothetical protein n=1 Tax=Clostridium sp. TaxID=1506 RepID=UPI002FDE4D1B
MTVLERLKIELNNKDYFTDDVYTMYLEENNLASTDTCNKEAMQCNLLLAIIDILESLSNDIDLMRKVEDGINNLNVAECYKLLEMRIQKIKDRIASIPDSDTEEYSNVFMLFTKNR